MKTLAVEEKAALDSYVLEFLENIDEENEDDYLTLT